MHWQLGGNFGPVLKACEYRWKECSYALAHYIWFEVVTDVADSLANELTLWKILAVVLMFMTIIHFMYWKKQWIKEINITNETLKKIEFKVQDLELKMNILTYKAQYDTWPLSQLVKVNNESDSDSNPSTYSKLNPERAYLKYFLARTRRKRIENKALMFNTEPRSILSEMNICDVKTKCIQSSFNEKLMQQTSYTEKKLSLSSLEQKTIKTEQLCDKGFKNNLTSNLSEEPTTEENLKLYRSSSDSSLNDHLRSTYLGSKKITKINVKPGKLIHRKRISPETAEKQLKFSISSTNNISSSKNVLYPKFFKHNHQSSYEENDSKEETHETLRQVKEKLQCLHSTLPNYSENCESNNNKYVKYLSNTLNISQSLNKEKDNFHKANNSYDCIKNQQGDCNYDECISLQKDNNNHKKFKVKHPEEIKKVKTSKITSQSNENVTKKSKKKNNIYNCATEDQSNLLENDTSTDGCYAEIGEITFSNPSRIQTKDTITDSDDNKQISLVETSKESDSDDRSISALIQEALKFKQELMLQIEARKEKDEINMQSAKGQNESGDYLTWHSDSDFEPNSLDKITEESSASSVVDKNSKTHILISAENCNNQNISNDKTSLRSPQSVNHVVENGISNKKINSNEILTDNEKQNQDTSLQNTEEIYHSQLNENLKVDSNLNPLSDTSSDTSVNRLLDRLIESERKCKSAKSLTNSKIKEDAADHLNTFIIPHTFFDNAPFESKQNSLPVEEYDAEGHSTEKIGSAIESYKNKNFDLSLNTDELQESESTQIVCDAKRVMSKQNDKDNLFKNNSAKLNESEIENIEISQCLVHIHDSNNIEDQHFHVGTYLSVNDANVTALTRNIDDSKNVAKSMSELENNERKNKSSISKKDAGDFYSDSEIIAQKNSQNSKKNVFPSGDSNSPESNTFSKSAVKLKSNLYHSFCKGQNDTNIQTTFKSSEQCSTKSHKNSNSNLVQKPPVKTNFEFGYSKQLKAKSNLNLSAMEYVNTPSTHRRCKSQVTSCDIPLTCEYKRAESETFSVPLDTVNHSKKMEEEKENLCTALEIYKKSFSKPCTPQSSRTSSNEIEIQFQRKENNSPSLSSKLSSKSSTPSKDSNLENNCNKNEVQRKPSKESIIGKPIPILLKNSLESARSLKMNTECFGPEDINGLEENKEKQENTNITEFIKAKDDVFANSREAFKLVYGTDSHDYVSSYINTMIEDIQTNTNQNYEEQIFYDYENELINHTNNDQVNSKDKETSLIPAQGVLLDSLENHDDDLTCVISPETCSLNVQSTSSRVLSYKDSKESEVLAKPCTVESSTSMSDIHSRTCIPNNEANKLMILENEIPEQVTKEEYVTLLQLINDHPDYENLLNLGVRK